MKVLRASRAAAHQAGHTCSYGSSPPLRLLRFFLKGCLHCASHSSSISISLPFTGPRCRADGGVWQTFPVPDSLLCSGAPAVPAAISPSGLCQGIRPNLSVSRSVKRSVCWPGHGMARGRKPRARDANHSRHGLSPVAAWCFCCLLQFYLWLRLFNIPLTTPIQKRKSMSRCPSSKMKP